MKSCEQIFFELPQCLSPWSQDAKMIKTRSSTSQPKEREREIAMIRQLAKYKTKIQDAGFMPQGRSDCGASPFVLRALQQ